MLLFYVNNVVNKLVVHVNKKLFTKLLTAY